MTAICVCCAQIHWFSIINSCVTVLLLTGFLATILMRVLKNDFVKYTRDDEAGALIRSAPSLSSACSIVDQVYGRHSHAEEPFNPIVCTGMAARVSK